MDATPPPLPRRRLPIGIQNLAKLRDQNCYYVDKTGMAIDLIESGSYFFLSRPRRFGKSLLVDTFKELFEGNRTLFAGLAAETRWDWSRRHPVVRISFAGGGIDSPERLEERIHELIDENERRLGVQCRYRSVTGRFTDLIRQAHARHGAPVVVLIDEYDKPILDRIAEPALAERLREGLKALYESFKAVDEHLRFVFLTGVSKFSKVSLFSGLNNLQDITLDAPATARCAATPTTTSTRSSRPNYPAWTGARSAAGTTATTGSAPASTTPSTCCCCSIRASSAPTGSRPARQPSWSGC